MIDIKDLEAFLAIVDSGSISHAAQDLGLTQPAISLKLKKIENELGVKLFQRTPRSMVPMPTALGIVPKVREILIRFDGIRESLSDEVSSLEGPVRIGCLMGWFDSLLLPAFASIHQTAPKIQLKFQVDQTNDLMHLVSHGQLDLAIVAHPFEHNEGVVAEKIMNEELVLFGKRLPKGQNKSEKKQNLLSRPWVTMSTPDPIVDTFWSEMFDGESFPWRSAHVVACIDHILAIPKIVTSIENALCIVPRQIIANFEGHNGFESERASRLKNGLYLVSRAGSMELQRYAIVASHIKQLAQKKSEEKG